MAIKTSVRLFLIWTLLLEIAILEGTCRQLFFPTEFMFGSKRLMKHIIATIKVFEFDLCELQCYHEPNCVSINFNVIADSSGLHECELNNVTHRSYGHELKNKDGYLYKAAQSACDKRRCKNGGTCQSGYTDKGYRCLCPPQWASHDCDKDVNECEQEQMNLCDKNAFCENTKGSYNCHCKHGFVGDGFNCTVIIPDPFAWFPLNGTYNTSEVKMRTTAGSKGNKVYLSLGPDGTKDGSYFFRGPGASSITFSDTSSKFDIGISMTILCWLYIYNNKAKTSFLQYKDTELSVQGKTLALNNPNLKGLSLTGTFAEKGWAFVGVSYSETSAEASLWIDGNVVLISEELGTNVDSREGSESLTLGGNQFKGKITQLMLFNLTLTQEQIKLIKRRMKLPAVGQLESKWKLCYNALASGWEPKIFHRNCDNKTHTVTIIGKSSNVFGGYTDIPWESPSSGTWGETLNAFIFFLKKSERLPPFKCFAKDKSKAIYKSSGYGPIFGEDTGLLICSKFSQGRAEAKVTISESYSVPAEVNDNYNVLAGTAAACFPHDNYEVFYLT
ncbi:uncharacterized protein [Acropora muricata]|uniref:uncharacterized protein isoform X2 n=1 Tax=Acropora muricata TaxID=159855 RepID=UPI0034E4B15F